MKIPEPCVTRRHIRYGRREDGQERDGRIFKSIHVRRPAFILATGSPGGFFPAKIGAAVHQVQPGRSMESLDFPL